MDIKEYTLSFSKPIWIKFPRLDVGDRISKTIILIGTEDKAMGICYSKENCKDFSANPKEFNISKKIKLLMTLTWVKTSDEPLNVTLRFDSTEPVPKHFFINCTEKEEPKVKPETRDADEESILPMEVELRELEVAKRLRSIRSTLQRHHDCQTERFSKIQKALAYNRLQSNFILYGNAADILVKNFDNIYDRKKKNVDKLMYSDYLKEKEIHAADLVTVEEFHNHLIAMYQLRCAMGHELPSVEETIKTISTTLSLINSAKYSEVYTKLKKEFVPKSKNIIPVPDDIKKYGVYVKMGLEKHAKIIIRKQLDEYCKLHAKDASSSTPSG